MGMYGNNKKSKAAKGNGKGMPKTPRIGTGTVNKPMSGKAPKTGKRVTSKRIY